MHPTPEIFPLNVVSRPSQYASSPAGASTRCDAVAFASSGSVPYVPRRARRCLLVTRPSDVVRSERSARPIAQSRRNRRDNLSRCAVASAAANPAALFPSPSSPRSSSPSSAATAAPPPASPNNAANSSGSRSPTVASSTARAKSSEHRGVRVLQPVRASGEAQKQIHGHRRRHERA